MYVVGDKYLVYKMKLNKTQLIFKLQPSEFLLPKIYFSLNVKKLKLFN